MELRPLKCYTAPSGCTTRQPFWCHSGFQRTAGAKSQGTECWPGRFSVVLSGAATVTPRIEDFTRRSARFPAPQYVGLRGPVRRQSSRLRGYRTKSGPQHEAQLIHIRDNHVGGTQRASVGKKDDGGLLRFYPMLSPGLVSPGSDFRIGPLRPCIDSIPTDGVGRMSELNSSGARPAFIDSRRYAIPGFFSEGETHDNS